jgi:hypothetical protein
VEVGDGVCGGISYSVLLGFIFFLSFSSFLFFFFICFGFVFFLLLWGGSAGEGETGFLCVSVLGWFMICVFYFFGTDLYRDAGMFHVFISIHSSLLRF